MTNPTDTEMLDYVEGNDFTFEKRPSGYWRWTGCGYKPGHLPTLREAVLQTMKIKKEIQNKELDAAWKLFREAEAQLKAGSRGDGTSSLLWFVTDVGWKSEHSYFETREEAMLAWYRKHKQQEKDSE